MATQVQFRGGTTTEHSSFNGAAREVTVDTTKQTLVVQDGSTNGGFPLLRQDLDNLPAGTIDNADINASAAIAGTKIAPDFGSQDVKTTGLLEIAASSCHVDLMETGTTNHRIRNGSGNFHIQKISDDKSTVETQLLIDGGTGEVKLYCAGSSDPKFNTNADGAHVTGTITASGQITGNSSNSTKYVRMYGGAGTGKWDIYGHGANLRFSDNLSTGHIHFDTNVGIRQETPVGDLHVTNGTRANIAIAKSGLTVKANSDLHTSYDVVQLGAGGLLASYNAAVATADTQLVHNGYRGDGGSWEYRYDDTAMRFRMNSPANTFIWDTASTGTGGNSVSFADVMKLDSSGDLTISDGNLVVANNHGISFAASSDVTGVISELLDDYEEGNFVATDPNSNYTFGTAAGAYQYFSYSKVGNIVCCHGQVHIQTGSGTFGISLPFTPRAQWSSGGQAQDVGYANGAVRLYDIDTPSDGIDYSVMTTNGVAQIALYASRDNATSTKMDNISSGSYISFSITYTTAT